MSGLLWLGGALLATVLLPLLLGPVLVRFAQKLRARPGFERVEPESGRIPSEVFPFFNATLRALAPEGFREAGYLRQTGFAPNVETWLLMLENRPAREAALALVGISTLPSQRGVKTRQVDFSSSWEGERSVTVSNGAYLSLFPPTPGVLVQHFPGLDDPRRLLEAHRALVARHAPAGLARRYPPPGEFESYLLQAMQRELARQVPTGYLWLDDAGEFYRPTWKGALLMTWKLAWPVKPVRGWRHGRRARRLLAELGV